MADGFQAGSIVAMLQLDKSGWNAAVKSVDKDTLSLKDKIAKAGTTVSALGAKFALAGGVITGAIVGVVKKTADMGDALNDMSKRTGVSVETLSSFRLACDQSGTSLEGFGKGLQKLAINMNEANTGNQTAIDKFKVLDVSVTDAEGKLRPLDDVMLDVAERFKTMPDGAQKSAIAFELFGKAGVELIPLLNQGRDGLLESQEAAKKLGITFSTEAAQACDAFNDRMAEMKLGLGGAAKEIGMALMPAVTDLVKSITSTVTKIREWVAAHPELAKQIGGVALKVGVLLTVVGPLMMIIPKIISGISGMATTLFSSVGMWTAAAAAVGFYVLKLIELKGAKEAAAEADKRFKDNQEFVRQKLFEVATAAGFNKDEFDALTKKYGENLSELRKGIVAGKEGADIQGKLAEAAGKHKDAAEEQKKKQAELNIKMGEFVPIVIDATAKTKTWGEVLQEYGVLPLKEKKERIDELLGYEDKLNQMLKDGKIDATEYGKGIKALNDDLKGVGSTTSVQVLPPSRDLGNIWKETPAQLDKVAYSIKYFGTEIGAIGAKAHAVGQTVTEFIYNIRRAVLSAKGISLPPFDASEWKAGVKETTDSTALSFDNLWSDVARGFGDAVTGMLFEGDSLKEGWKGICNAMKEAVSSMIGEMVTKWVKGLLTDMVGTATTAATTTASTFSTMGAAVGGVATTIGTVITTLATAIGTAIGTIAAGIGTAIVAIATAVATAATVLAAAIVPLLIIGALAVALYVAFGLAKGLLDKLFGGGGGKSSDVTYWLKLMLEVQTNTMNWFKSAGSGFGGASYEFITAHMGDWLTAIKISVDETRTGICAYINTSNVTLRQIRDRLKNLKSAAKGATIADTELVAVHGTPSTPEYIIPSPDLKALLAATPQKKAGANVTVKNEVNINGTVITDREWVRGRLINELKAALKSGIGTSELKLILGV